MRLLRAIAMTLVLALAAFSARAVTQAELLADPAQEQRARALSSELRCLVCQNQSIDESDAELARDLRRLVRERIVAGESDQAIRGFLVARYGEFVLLKPQLTTKTAILWSLPFLALLGGGGLAFSLFRKKSKKDRSEEYILNIEERAELQNLLESKEPKAL